MTPASSPPRRYSGRFYPGLFRICPLILTVCLLACVSGVTGRFADNLSHAVVNHNDPETVKTGGPAYLLMIDGLLRDDPENASLLRAAAKLYTAYTDIYVEDPERAGKLTEKALTYADRALCSASDICMLRKCDFAAFAKRIAETDEKDLPFLFTMGSAWAGWIQARREDWNAVADIARVELLMRRVTEINEQHQEGAAHLYLGILTSLTPPALGGKPEEGKEHFERALEISGRKNLMILVAYARHYARTVFDRALHDRLLEEVIRSSPDQEGYTLLNTLAREQARELLREADDYF
ncbi:MAG: TRAP transporter TatT component family protein [Desulfococcaceae bacterium]|nr:TRAP transporter TatT component family protein [Desulfococcaceae bacterium]